MRLQKTSGANHGESVRAGRVLTCDGKTQALHCFPLSHHLFPSLHSIIYLDSTFGVVGAGAVVGAGVAVEAGAVVGAVVGDATGASEGAGSTVG